MGKIFDSTTIGFIVAALILFLVSWGIKGYELALSGVKNGLILFLRYALLIAASMVFATLLQLLIPKEIIVNYLGASSGWRGILLGAIIGGLTPGSPYAALPFFIGLMKSGAGVPTGVAMVSAWGLYSVGRIPFELAVMGGKFTLVQVLSTILFPFLAGILASLIHPLIK